MNRHTADLANLAIRYPTPTVQDGENCGGPSQLKRHSAALNVLAKFPTPRTEHLCGGTGAFDKLRALADAGEITEEERAAAVRSFQTDGPSAQLNPDWVEWLMGWPVGWTDVTRDECDWRDLSVEPEDIHIATTRRENRPARIKAIGNGQVPLCAAVAAEYGFAWLEAVHALTSSPSGTSPEAGGLFRAGSSSPRSGVFHPPVFSPAPSRNDGNQPQTKQP